LLEVTVAPPYLDGGGDFVEHLPVGVDEEGVRIIGQAGGDVGVDEVRPAEVVGGAVEGGEITAGLPLGVGKMRLGALEDGGHGWVSWKLLPTV
jgi:hypothetical protein